MDSSKVNSVVIPGDLLGEVTEGVKVRLGPGIRREGGQLLSSKCGVLRCRPPVTYWVDNNQKRYVPVQDERVLGVVIAKPGDNFKVDIGASMPASLPYLNFQGATKHNRPNVQVGDIVNARLCVANKDVEPELTCVDPGDKANGMGVLHCGFVFQCSLGLCRKLLVKNSPLKEAFGRHFKFELAVGQNGRVWLTSVSTALTIALANAFDAADLMSLQQVEQMVTELALEVRS